MTLEATGYGPADNGPWGDRTALGTKVGYATVAVDPKVIPLRTRLWVEGYGFCVALDTGGAIKGNRIDLGHDNQSDAIRVGRKKLRVLVLD
jgi:3D (Asp-Asp-Asp) domain-containing protein